jgi:hypothetical protein
MSFSASRRGRIAKFMHSDGLDGLDRVRPALGERSSGLC